MRSLFTLFTAISAVLIPLAVAQSPLPFCFVCPPQDLAGRPLIAHSESASELFCRYQTVPNDFFCKYFISTGLQKQDHDQGKCPVVADVSNNCQTLKKKRGGVPRSPYPPSPAARSPKPRTMKVRSELGSKKKRAQ